MTHNQQAVDAAAAVTTARGALDKLLEIERMLETELPAAWAAFHAANKKLRAVTRPTRSAVRKHELDILKQKLEVARNV
ncbi:hypothetical protein [Pseudomonas sp. MPC6]|uniref:hypothetical protein n=1 Tax=unclassified Pseudomonas TaxID=196821 RepID=UPI001110F150|nr:hypothetical protein [Pseudomonas sp. MPC6]QCY11124.1 hypothetical protein ELQ88_10020 [Pseudomonas sp. MPC6]